METIDHLLKLDLAWQETEGSGNKMRRISRGSLAVDQLFRGWIYVFIWVTVSLIGAIFILFKFEPFISVVMIGFVVIYYVTSLKLTRLAVAASDEVNKVEDDVSGLTFEAVNNIRTVKALGFTKNIFTRIRAVYDRAFRQIRTRVFRFQSRNTILDLGISAVEFTLTILIIYGVLMGRYEVGFLVLFNGYFFQIWHMVGKFAEATQDFYVSQNSIARMADVLKAPIKIEDTFSKKKLSRDWQEISVKDLHFGYDQHDVIKGVSFKIRRGEKIGLVGSSGAGKSTIFKLLLKEYEDYEGGICLDGIPLKDISPKSYYEQTAVVLQDTEVFDFTLEENITIANPAQRKNSKLLNKSLKLAHIDSFLNRLPKGLETLIGEKGVKLSGGERQRVGIARAVFKEPELLFLDEATSHLDLESEEQIQDSLSKVFKKVTAVVIAHRLTTIKEMDRILVLEDGQIVERGNFRELMKQKGRFYTLWEKQRF